MPPTTIDLTDLHRACEAHGWEVTDHGWTDATRTRYRVAVQTPDGRVATTRETPRAATARILALLGVEVAA